MRSHALRLDVFSLTVWVARRGASPALRGLAVREQHLRHEARVVEKAVRRRWADYRRRLHAREAQIHALERRHAAPLAAANAAAASAPSYSSTASSVVTLPPQVRVATLPPAGPSASSGSSHP